MNKISLLAVALLASAAVPAMAASNPATANFNVTLTVNKACSVSATDMAFGTHDFSETGPLNANSTITVKCTKGTAYTVALNKGTNGADETHRVMKGASNDTVAYSIANDSNGGTNFGTAAGTKGGTGNGANQTITAYGQVLTSALNVTAENYSDVVAVSVTY